MEAFIARAKRVLRWHPMWSLKLDVVSMMAYLTLIVATITAVKLQWIGETSLGGNGQVLAGILGGATLIVAIQVAGDIRRYWKAKRLLIKQPYSGSRAAIYDYTFYSWLMLRLSRENDPRWLNKVAEISLTMEYLRYQEQQRRGNFTKLVVAILVAELIFRPAVNIQSAYRALRSK